MKADLPNFYLPQISQGYLTYWVTESEYFQEDFNDLNWWCEKKKIKVLKINVNSYIWIQKQHLWQCKIGKAWAGRASDESDLRNHHQDLTYLTFLSFTISLWESMNHFVIKCCVWREAVESHSQCEIAHIQKVPLWTESCWHDLIMSLH